MHRVTLLFYTHSISSHNWPNGMFDHHWAEITVMQFTGHPLLVHQFVTAPWDFNLVPYCQPSSPTQSLPITGQRNMQLPPSLEWHVWPGQRSVYNNHPLVDKKNYSDFLTIVEIDFIIWLVGNTDLRSSSQLSWQENSNYMLILTLVKTCFVSLSHSLFSRWHTSCHLLC